MVGPVALAAGVKMAAADPVAALAVAGVVTAGAWLGWRLVRSRLGVAPRWSWEWEGLSGGQEWPVAEASTPPWPWWRSGRSG